MDLTVRKPLHTRGTQHFTLFDDIVYSHQARTAIYDYYIVMCVDKMNVYDCSRKKHSDKR